MRTQIQKTWKLEEKKCDKSTLQTIFYILIIILTINDPIHQFRDEICKWEWGLLGIIYVLNL